MSWNPSDQNKDPWGRDKKTPQGPPDLDALLRQYKNKLLAAFSKKGSQSTGNSGGSQPQTKTAFFMTTLVVLTLLILWALSGIFIVSPAERAVIQRFGRYVTTVGPGPHWLPRFIESEKIVNVQRVSNYTYESEMLTKDENIVSVAVAVHYRVVNARDFLFNVVDPEATLEQATASALRQAVGHNNLDDLLTQGRQRVREQVAKQLQEILANYKVGILVTDVNLQSIKAPAEVTAAFDDVIKAREDQQSYMNKADAYSRQVIANAKGQAARILQEAEANKIQTVYSAKSQISGYLALLPQYLQAPQLTKERLYLTALETVMTNSSKVLLDMKPGSNPVVYLPLDKMNSAMSALNQQSTEAANKSVNNKMDVTNGVNTTSDDGTNNATTSSILQNRASYPTRGDNQ